MNTTKRTDARTTKTTRTRRTSTPRRRPACRRTRAAPESTRRYIVIGIIGLIAITAIVGIWMPAALPILEKLLPSLGMMCGYYFGQLQA